MLVSVLNRSKFRLVGISSLVAVSAIVVGATFGYVSTATAAPVDIGSPPHGASEGVNPEEVLSILGNQNKPGTSKDSIELSREQLEDHGVDGIEPSSLRALGSDNDAQYWAGTDSAGNICVITRTLGQDILASGCNTPNSVEKTGVWIAVFGDPKAPGYVDKTAILLPDSVAQTGTEDAVLPTEPWTVISANLVVADSSALKDGEIYSFKDGSGQRTDVEFTAELIRPDSQM